MVQRKGQRKFRTLFLNKIHLLQVIKFLNIKIRQQQLGQKEQDETIFELKDELYKTKKQLQVKNTEVKQLIDQDKAQDDKNIELSKINVLLQQQLIYKESYSQQHELKQQLNEKSIQQENLQLIHLIKFELVIIKLISG
ncbi:unnamed protein product (macronuclear) [Paramecium tetraurelia]|uniref:Uncharacterized protein n=1 Tax=Paramecium tetraurelia TaxID=5888 RepID=A0E9U2_PARTE|nr:uncharacterized protein GSPATT00024790001 [Paramecium tetraurelia]CAK92059.1 unnamed protein product [Paramecium tetraurelia]|eukprot:XP_001459456.1 hypothetical protein (macronuclear) [Paramecium tetraurelia strain d4-2]